MDKEKIRRSKNLAVLFILAFLLLAFYIMMAFITIDSLRDDVIEIRERYESVRDSLSFERMRAGELEELLILNEIDDESKIM